MGFSIDLDRIPTFFRYFCQKKLKKGRRPSEQGFENQNGPKWTKKYFAWGPILRLRFAKKPEKWRLKKPIKNQPSQKLVFRCNLVFPEGKTLNFNTFWVGFASPRATFSNVFLCSRFGLKFEAFFAKNLIKAKTRKVAFVL